MNKYCSFCARSNKEAGPLVEGRALAESEFGDENSVSCICEDCAETVIETYERNRASNRTTRQRLKQIPTPRQILKHLDTFIIGQTAAKKIMAVQVHAHYKRLIDFDDMVSSSEGQPFVKDADLRDVEIEKSNSLLIGPTGCGKTLMAKALAAYLDVPLAIGDATTLTEAGYVGEDVENLLLKLIQAADYDIEAAQRGIIYIDEIDKIGKTGGNVSITRDVSGEGVQQSLLKLIEGTVANVPPQGGRKHPEQQYVQIDTSNILFICGGAFNGLSEIIKQRLGKKRMGFGNVGASTPEDELKEKNAVLAQVQPEDLDKFGLIPELIGRLPVITALEELDVETLVKILREPKNALLKQYQKDAAYNHVKIEFTDDAAVEIAERAAKRKTGARALRAICEEFMSDIRFEIPESSHRGKKYVVDASVVRGERSVFGETKEAA